MTERRGPWLVHSHEDVFETAWMKVESYPITRPDGLAGHYGVVHFKNRALAILPLFETGETILVGQHRFPQDKYSWEIPEGGGDLDGDPQQEAARELKEETGLIAQRWKEVLRMDLSNSITDESAIGYIATGLTQGEAEPEGTEVLETRRLHFREVLARVISGEITDSLTVAMVLKAHYMALHGLLDADLSQALLSGADSEGG
ncbi:MAG: NUDIX hydrolase [Alphaproteobacteria bacterium]|nr:NUDIX hydrolase [Alphaproteobacteria bacterium]